MHTGLENTNFIDDLGKETKEGSLLGGCLLLLLIIVLVIGAIVAATAGFTLYTLSKQKADVVFKDGKRAITFKPPEKWACFNAKDVEGPYIVNKVFVEKKKYHAVLDKVSYKKVKYSKSRMQYSTADIAKQVRAALKAKELMTAVLDTEKAEVKAAYDGYKRVKCVYKKGYGYAVFKKPGLARCYYFRAVKNFMLVMVYIYEDSDKNRESAKAEEEKLKDMWEAAFVVK